MIPGMQSEQITPADMKAAFKMIDVDRKFKVPIRPWHLFFVFSHVLPSWLPSPEIRTVRV